MVCKENVYSRTLMRCYRHFRQYLFLYRYMCVAYTLHNRTAPFGGFFDSFSFFFPSLALFWDFDDATLSFPFCPLCLSLSLSLQVHPPRVLFQTSSSSKKRNTHACRTTSSAAAWEDARKWDISRRRKERCCSQKSAEDDADSSRNKGRWVR